jgi:chemotaxis protein MotB
MARRRKAPEEHDNHERWLVSYADFITLLFAFFVVMYSLSSVNEGKYKVLSDSLVTAFRNIHVNEDLRTVEMPHTASDSVVPPIVAAPKPTASEAQARRAGQVQQMRNMADDIRRVLEPLTRSGQVTVSEGAHGISVEINASVLFASGEASLSLAAIAPLQAVARVLSQADFPIRVEGHTDNAPINTYRFPSNWELSSARASSVVRLFIESGVPAGNLTAAGYSDQRPIADNNTDSGRARNRRVTILIESLFAEPELGSGPVPLSANDPILSVLPPEESASSAATSGVTIDSAVNLAVEASAAVDEDTPSTQ